MPKTKTDEYLRFRMDTASFVTIWRNHIAKPDADNWKKFVLACFERFYRDGNNMKSLTSVNKGGTIGMTDDDKYLFLSERCYSKCMTIRTKLKKEGFVVDLPEGYLSRTGAKKSKRISTEDMISIFKGDDI